MTCINIDKSKLNIKETLKIMYTTYLLNWINYNWINYLKSEMSDCNSVLDLGCGYNSPLQYCNVPHSIGVELFEPYLEESKSKNIHSKYIEADIRKIEFKSKSFDAVLCLEVLEHLPKDEGYELLKKIEKWGKKIIITTPNEYLWQDGYDNNPLQRHVSGWSVRELEKMGFEVYGMNGWKKLRGYQGSIKYKPKNFWLIFSDLTQKMVYRNPKLAFQLFSIKKDNK